MEFRLIADVGSCHGGSLDTAKEFIDALADFGVKYIKFQLITPGQERQNCATPLSWVPTLINHRSDVMIFFSMFGRYFARNFLLDMSKKTRMIKFAHSQRNSHLIATALDAFDEVIVTTNVMDRYKLPQNSKLTVLFTQTDSIGVERETVYPVTTKMDYSFLKLGDVDGKPLFNGFSDHTIGISQTIEAIRMGANIIEKHVCFSDTSQSIPDARFAILPSQMKEIMNAQIYIDSGYDVVVHNEKVVKTNKSLRRDY